ncbi:MAG TPA: ComEA family DNA-binding protein [Actinocrinis sp.]|nr:ComEA family DNA-binding protein [Actinocrinis sp.]
MPLPEDFEFGARTHVDALDESAESAYDVEPPAPVRRPPSRRTDRIRGWIADRLPDPLKGRWRMDHRVGMALSAVAVISAFAMGGYALWSAQPEQKPQQFAVAGSADQGYAKSADQADGRTPAAESGSDTDPASGSGDGDPPQAGSMSMPMADPLPAAGATTEAPILVDVEGRVARPGVQRLPAGSRVLDALTMAGGALPGTDLSNLDQARVLGDGEQVMVGPGGGGGAVPGAGASAPAAKGRTKAVPSAPIRLNTATLEQLEELPGVGPALAQRVLDWRSQNGRFASVDDLQQVKGFGPHKFAAVRALVTP